MANTTRQAVLFPDLFSKPVQAGFSRDQLSTYGGTVLLATRDRQLGLSEALCAELRDGRQPGKVRHELLDQLRQRVFGIAVGCADGNDAAKLRADPLLKLACDRDPAQGEALASQPTLSRFENAVRRGELLRLSERLAATVLGEQVRRRRGRRPRRIIIDLDPTCDPTYGDQQLTFFNGFLRADPNTARRVHGRTCSRERERADVNVETKEGRSPLTTSCGSGCRRRPARP